jgi:hypothetical protein
MFPEVFFEKSFSAHVCLMSRVKKVQNIEILKCFHQEVVHYRSNKTLKVMDS